MLVFSRPSGCGGACGALQGEKLASNRSSRSRVSGSVSASWLPLDLELADLRSLVQLDGETVDLHAKHAGGLVHRSMALSQNRR